MLCFQKKVKRRQSDDLKTSSFLKERGNVVEMTTLLQVLLPFMDLVPKIALSAGHFVAAEDAAGLQR